MSDTITHYWQLFIASRADTILGLTIFVCLTMNVVLRWLERHRPNSLAMRMCAGLFAPSCFSPPWSARDSASAP